MLANRRIRYPGALIAAAFGGTILVGTALLALPISHEQPSVGLDDAFFTATSAVTVTGLGVVDTGPAWSTFGELVLLVLIQVGGLGIMTLAGVLGIALNQRLRLRSSVLVGAEIGVADAGALRGFLGDLVVFVAATETLVAVLLTARFLAAGDGIATAAHRGVFHAVSAFNNAGFSTLDRGLESHAGDWFLVTVIALAFVIGGLGFPVVFELRDRWRTPSRWSLHTKVTVSTTAFLLVAGSIVIGAIEWSNPATLGALETDERILAAGFQSATARTAGFNTIPIGAMREGSWMVLILLMVIGAGSASTGGGIKVTTFAIAVRSTLGELRGDSVTTMFDRTVPRLLERRALSLIVAAVGSIGLATFLLVVTQPGMPLGDLVFEAASAFGTVGLTTGVTTELDTFGRLVVIGLMFIGRVGPITFGTAVLLRSERTRYGYVEEELLIG